MQTERTNLLNNDSVVIPNNYFQKALFGLGCIGGVTCVVVQAISIGESDITSTKTSDWISLAGAVSLLGVSIYALACTFNPKSYVVPKPLHVVDFKEDLISESNSEITEILKKLNDIFQEILGDKAIQDENQGLSQLELIRRVFAEKKIFAENMSKLLDEKKLKQQELQEQLNTANLEKDALVRDVETMRIALDDFEIDMDLMKFFLGDKGTTVSADKIQSVRSILLKDRTDSNSSTSGTSTPVSEMGSPVKPNISLSQRILNSPNRQLDSPNRLSNSHICKKIDFSGK